MAWVHALSAGVGRPGAVLPLRGARPRVPAGLGCENTPQHWLVHDDELYLVYTRHTGENQHIMRGRAPLFVAQVDQDRLVLRRHSDRVLLSERGVPMGNFAAATLQDGEAWVTVGETLPADGWAGDTLLARILWDRPNELVPGT